MKKSYRTGRLYTCDCTLCKSKKKLSYSTVQRHLSVYGKAKVVTEQTESNEYGYCAENTDMHDHESSLSTDSYQSEINDFVEESHDDEDAANSSSDSEDNQILPTFEANCFEVSMEDSSSVACSPVACSNSPILPSIPEQDEVYTANENESSAVESGLLQPVLRLNKSISILLVKVKVKYKLSDNVLIALLSILQLIFSLISHPLQYCFPKTVQKLFVCAGVNQVSEFKRYAVCPDSKCCNLLDCTLLSEATTIPICKRQAYNSHCREQLCYEKFLSFGKSQLVPYKTFIYLSPIVWLKKFYCIKKFEELLKIQLRYTSDCGIINDVWDGRVWKSFNRENHCGDCFFKNAHNIAFIINVDWFKPFKNSEYKVGGIYMNVLNLPRTERYKTKWTMLIGLIPGPSEPKENINSFLEPLVNDLTELWNGVQIHIHSGASVVIRGALIAVSCDIPAARKVSQFLGHKANKGCSRCEFEGERENPRDATSRMSYFTVADIIPRLNGTVRLQADEFLGATNATEAKKIQKKNGVRWSQLLKLTYFDIVTMITVDPMHTVLLGMVRHETELILQDPLFCKESQIVFSSRLKRMRVPYDVGRLPSSLGEKLEFFNLTADQWKNFALIYAKPCLWDLLPPDSYESICMLCEIVQIVVQPLLTDADISRLDYLLKSHHRCFENNYGRFQVSVNYHMALHIPDMIKDFGPPHAFWCFGFERMNGVLSGLPNSNRYVELELLTKFLQNVDIESVVPHDPLVTSWPHLDDILPVEREISSSVMHPSLLNVHVKSMFSSSTQDRYDLQQSIDKGETNMFGYEWKVEYLPPTRSDVQVTKDFYLKLLCFYEHLYEGSSITVIPRIDKHARCLVNGLSLTSDLHASDRSSIVKASFAVVDSEPYPYFGIVRFFFKSLVMIKGDSVIETIKSHDLAYVQWFQYYSSSEEPFFQITDEFYNGDEIISPRRLVSRCVLLKPYSNSPCKFVIDLPA